MKQTIKLRESELKRMIAETVRKVILKEKICDKPKFPTEIINTDQGSQCTTKAWEDLLGSHGIKVIMDGKGRC